MFNETEIDNACVEAQKPKDVKLKKIKELAESDSEPSIDNFEEEELVNRFEVAVSDDEIELLKPKQQKIDKKHYIEAKKKENNPIKPKEYKSIVESI